MINPLNSNVTMRPPANSYRKAEDQVLQDMDRRDTKAIESGKQFGKDAKDYQNAIGTATPQQTPQDAPPDISGEVEQTVQATDTVHEEAVVGILEGFETPNLESDGAVSPDFMGLLNTEIQKDTAAVDADLIQAGTFVKEEPAPAGTLENINSQEDSPQDSLLQMLQNAAARTTKGQQAQSDTTKEQSNTTTTEEPVTMGMAQNTRVEGAGVDSEFKVETAQPQVATQADMDQNVSRLVESIQANAADGVQEFTVQLKPEFLGRLSIKLVMDDDGIRAQIKAQDMNSKSLILHELPMLEESLKQKGLDVRQIEVTYEAPQFDFDPRQNSQGNWQFSQNSPKGQYGVFAMETETLVSYFELTEGVGHMLEGSSMEFQA